MKKREEIIKIQKAIKLIKQTFEDQLSKSLSLLKVSAPIMVFKESCLNDYLGINKSPITFYNDSLKKEIEIVQSLAKWKRLSLYNYGFLPGDGIYTDMNAIRPNEELDQTHSFYVEQWDWEKVLKKEEININTLREHVKKVYKAVCNTSKVLFKKFKEYKRLIFKDLFFISSISLEQMYPNDTEDERENKIARDKKVVFIEKIGYKLKGGKPHSNRAFDYDNWELNGDLIVYHEGLDKAIELSSMGIRVDSDALIKQAKEKGIDHNTLDTNYYKLVLENKNYTIGGGIGQSRLCQFLLDKKHIGEVQASIWNDDLDNFNIL